MKYALCNEVIRDLPFADQCAFAAAVGYDAIELAPFTLGETPHLMPASERATIRRAASDVGLEIVSLHWLLVTPPGLSIHSTDDDLRARTIAVLQRLIGLSADLGAKIMVHGSPPARHVPSDGDPQAYWARARDTFAAIADSAAQAGITYCIEALASRETNFINTIADAVAMVEAVDSPAMATMIDTCSSGIAETDPLPTVIDRWLPTGHIRHIQVNDTNKKAPGQGCDDFAAILSALRRNGYDGVIAVEPFIYEPDGAARAARAIGYLRGLDAALDETAAN